MFNPGISGRSYPRLSGVKKFRGEVRGRILEPDGSPGGRLMDLSIAVRVEMKYAGGSVAARLPGTTVGPFMSVDRKPPVHY